jgi:hypothetical protein
MDADTQTQASRKLEEIVNRGQQSAGQLFDHVAKQIPRDRLALGRSLDFRWGVAPRFAPAPVLLDADSPDARGLDGADDAARIMSMVDTEGAPKAVEAAPEGPSELLIDVADHTLTVHDNALRQLAQRATVPIRYLRQLLTSDTPELRALGVEILRTHYGDTSLAENPWFLRDVDGDLRGFLSDSYRPIDCRPVLDMIAKLCAERGLMPAGAHVTDVLCQLKVIIPRVFEPVSGQPYVFGFTWRNSDFGAGANGFAVFVMRLLCTNGMTSNTVVKQVHSGGKLPTDIELRQDTIEANTKASLLVCRDAIDDLTKPERIEKTLSELRQAADRPAEWSDYDRRLAKVLTKGEAARTKEAFEGSDVVMLPPGQTVFRMSNALSWIAQDASTARRIELERLAGRVMKGEAIKAAA